jgi:hypothetical protein
MIQEMLKSAGMKTPGECCEILVVFIFLAIVPAIAVGAIWIIFLLVCYLHTGEQNIIQYRLHENRRKNKFVHS